MPRGHKFDEEAPLFKDPEQYRRLVGRFLYLNMTRPDISFPVQQLSQHVAAPSTSHWESALCVVKYLKGTSSMGLFYKTNSDFSLEAYSDSDWASCPTSRRSITGYSLLLGGSLISWKSKKQTTISRSSCEAEYRSMASCVCELLWVSYLLHDLGVIFQKPIPFFCDNKAALHIASNPVFHERTKHIDIDCHLVRQRYKEGFIKLQHVASQLQLADIFTKSLSQPQFSFIIGKLGLVDNPQLEGGCRNKD